MDADEQYILDQLMEGFTPTPNRRSFGRGSRSRVQPRPVLPPTPAVRELLDEYELIFFYEDATLDYVEKAAGPWRQTGLAAREIREWLNAGVDPDEPDLAQALAAAGFEPRRAAQIKCRFGHGGEPKSVISWVRGASDRLARAVDLMNRVVAVRQRDAG